MDRIEIKTLMDVTNSKMSRSTHGTQLEQDQYRNFITLLQCLEIRSLIHFDHDPRVELIDITDNGFGTEYTGKQKVWTFVFSYERTDVYKDQRGNPVGLLLEDLHQVPLVKKLTETVNIDKAVFNTKDRQFTNTLIKALSGNL